MKPLKIIYGRGQNLYDENEQPYLDCINNVTHGELRFVATVIEKSVAMVIERSVAMVMERSLHETIHIAYIVCGHHWYMYNILSS